MQIHSRACYQASSPTNEPNTHTNHPHLITSGSRDPHPNPNLTSESRESTASASVPPPHPHPHPHPHANPSPHPNHNPNPDLTSESRESTASASVPPPQNSSTMNTRIAAKSGSYPRHRPYSWVILGCRRRCSILHSWITSFIAISCSAAAMCV